MLKFLNIMILVVKGLSVMAMFYWQYKLLNFFHPGIFISVCTGLLTGLSAYYLFAWKNEVKFEIDYKLLKWLWK